MWVVQKIARGMFHNNRAGTLDLDDLISIGHLGLCTSVTRFDDTRNTKFSTYAWPYVKGWISHALRDDSRLVRIPRDLLVARKKCLEMWKENVPLEEIAQAVGLKPYQVIEAIKSFKHETRSIDVEYQTDEDDFRGDTREILEKLSERSKDPDELYQNKWPRKLREIVETLSKSELDATFALLNGERLGEIKRSRALSVIQRIRIAANS